MVPLRKPLSLWKMENYLRAIDFCQMLRKMKKRRGSSVRSFSTPSSIWRTEKSRTIFFRNSAHQRNKPWSIIFWMKKLIFRNCQRKFHRHFATISMFWEGLSLAQSCSTAWAYVVESLMECLMTRRSSRRGWLCLMKQLMCHRKRTNTLNPMYRSSCPSWLITTKG